MAEPRKMSEMIKEMAEQLLRAPEGSISSEAMHISLMFAHIAWNETVGLVSVREGYRPAWEEIEAHNPEMWSEFKSNDVEAMIDQLVRYKQQHYPNDQRRILVCGIPNGNVRVEWMNPAAPGVDSDWEMTLHGLVRTGEQEQAIQYLQDTRQLSRSAASKQVSKIAADLGVEFEKRQVSDRQPVSKKAAKRKPATAKSSDPMVDEIAGLVAAFCREHLNEEYAVLCGRLVQKLARKRPSPLLSGQANTWACGIVRTIGWVNFLDDRSQKPHMKLTAIDKILGVGESTGQGKSMLIRKMLKIRMMDPEWTLPSHMDDNPMVWMIQVDGFTLDARYLTREIQEAAFRQGLIPYIPE